MNAERVEAMILDLIVSPGGPSRPVVVCSFCGATGRTRERAAPHWHRDSCKLAELLEEIRAE